MQPYFFLYSILLFYYSGGWNKCVYEEYIYEYEVNMFIQISILWEPYHWCSCGICEVCKMYKCTHRHTEKTQGGGFCVSSLSVLQSIDPALLLSAGYVSCTAALPVRGRAKARQGWKEERKTQINAESSNKEREGRKGKKEWIMMWINRDWNWIQADWGQTGNGVVKSYVPLD